jgi:hypothetical protein
LAILREARIDENRTPFSPSQISNLLKKLSNLKIIVQPSKRRCFKNERREDGRPTYDLHWKSPNYKTWNDILYAHDFNG